MTDEKKRDAVLKPIMESCGYQQAFSQFSPRLTLASWITTVDQRLKKMEHFSTLPEYVLVYNDQNSVDLNETMHILRQELIVSKFNFES